MRHAFFDRFSDLDSPVHRIRTGIKLSAAIIIISLLTAIPAGDLLIPVLSVSLLLLTLIIISRVPVLFIFKRLLILFPLLIPVFVLNFFFTHMGPEYSLIISARSILSLLVLILLVSVTRFRDILKTLSSWHVPKVIILTLSFMYRFFFLLTDEAEKMVRSVTVRSGNRSKAGMIRIYAHILGTLLIKSYERSDRVYKAMMMRGYDGKGDII